ncbi:MAG: JDVT-CTERM domain-containing protein [Salinisphaera sp.]|jgi:hypothetical protein|nr:JDVT-CTERM domain-containing protein [Salinisphaera sp.]
MKTAAMLAISVGLGLCAYMAGAHAATVQFINQDASGVGLNDSTAVAPVGGNTGTTLGAQRRQALAYAASILASRLGSSVPVRIAASFANADNSLPCQRNSATLGTARPTQYSVNFAGAPRSDTLYPLALANALAGSRIADRNDIALRFNPQLDAGGDNCLHGDRWYYGLDGNVPVGRIDFLATAVHELIHGFGFVSTVLLTNSTSSTVGQFPHAADGARYPDIFSRFIQDLSIAGQPLLTDLTDAERARAIDDGPYVVWSDSVTSNAAAGLLSDGFTQGRVRLYAPSPVDIGSSLSHWDTSLSPDQIMEPRANPDSSVLSGIGMAACVLENIGWQLINNTRCPDTGSATIAGDRAADKPIAVNGGKSASSSGGGCTIDPDALFDPLWFVLLLGAATTCVWRRRRPLV